MHAKPTKYYDPVSSVFWYQNFAGLFLLLQSGVGFFGYTDVPKTAANPNQTEIVFGKIKKDKLIETTFLVDVTVTATNAPNNLIKAKTKMRPKLELSKLPFSFSPFSYSLLSFTFHLPI